MTAFYSGRLLFMTFHGTPRCDEKTLAHVHESPAVMWTPLVVLVLGSLFAGAAFYYSFVGDDLAAFWGDSILILDTHQALHHAHDVPFWVKASPLVVGLASGWACPGSCMSARRGCRRRSPRRCVRSICSASTSGTSTSCTTRSS